jgi:aldose 1-epimerase
MPFAETHFDDVYSGVVIAEGKCTATVADPAAKRQLELEFDPEFPVCVVYNPPHRQAVCIEPYTCVPGLPMPANAKSAGQGLQILPPGGKKSLSFEIRLSAV